MNGFQKAMFILAMFVLVTQTVRHVYVKWFEARTSVLDQFTKNETDKEIDKAASLNELVLKYAPLKATVDQLDQESKGMAEADLKAFKDRHAEEYKREGQVSSAIRGWESKSNEIRELRVFWGIGLGLLLLGALAYGLGGQWLGMVLIIVAFTEMIWWTCPSFSWGGANREYDRLLNNKIFFSATALVLLLATWWARAWIDKARRTSAAARFA